MFIARQQMAVATSDQIAPCRAVLAEWETTRIVLFLRRQPAWTAREVARAVGLVESFALGRLYHLESIGLVWRCTQLVGLEWALTDAGEGLQKALIAIAESFSEGVPS